VLKNITQLHYNPRKNCC